MTHMGPNQVCWKKKTTYSQWLVILLSLETHTKFTSSLFLVSSLNKDDIFSATVRLATLATQCHATGKMHQWTYISKSYAIDNARIRGVDLKFRNVLFINLSLIHAWLPNKLFTAMRLVNDEFLWSLANLSLACCVRKVIYKWNFAPGRSAEKRIISAWVKN